jgi:amino acid transporter
MTFYNLMSGDGFVGGAYSHDWIMAWASIAILALIVYVVHIMSKNGYIPSGFNWQAGLMGIVAALVIISFLGWAKIGLLVGVIVLAVIGFWVGE